MRVVVIDDEAALRKALCDALEIGGFDAVGVPNGLAAFDEVKRRPTDVVVTDIFMPEQDGVEIIIRLRQEFPKLKILAISGGGTSKRFEFLDAAATFGADMTLHKPFQMKNFINLVRRLVS